jgi:ketosteroid isomerase-like protein
MATRATLPVLRNLNQHPMPASRLESPVEVFNRLHQFVLQYDADGQAELFAQDAIWEFPFAPTGIQHQLSGREQIRTVIKGGMQRSRQSGRRLLRYENVVVHQTQNPELIIVEFTLHGENAATGEPYDVPYIQVLQVRDGQIILLRDYFPGEVLQRALTS